LHVTHLFTAADKLLIQDIIIIWTVSSPLDVLLVCSQLCLLVDVYNAHDVETYILPMAFHLADDRVAHIRHVTLSLVRSLSCHIIIPQLSHLVRSVSRHIIIIPQLSHLMHVWILRTLFESYQERVVKQ